MTQPVVKPNVSLIQRLLRTPIFYKILLANSAIVGLGATIGTMVTVWHVSRYPDQTHYSLIIVFAVCGIVISFFVNRWVLKWALSPLGRLQEAVNQVRQGHKNVQVQLDPVSDEQLDRLVETFNQMLGEHEEHARLMTQLPRRILKAQEEERQRLARDLHDEAAQALTSLLVHIRLLERAYDPEQAQQRVRELRELTAQALEEVRRVALDLRPSILDDLGLGAALEWRVDEFRQANGVQTNVQIEGLGRRLPREVELVFYRVGQEALTNIARHAQAQQVDVSLRREKEYIRLEVSDDGLGFNPSAIPQNTVRGLGLLGMQERLAMIHGDLVLDTKPGHGTRVLAQAPLNNESNGATYG